ncbi:ADP-ribosylglycohydrolase [Candidatus Magnetoovum chiemensis]|nr:ADP-ribosylglycohydrolase [Candidatus Magnetoovum chiemensis]
MNDERLERAAIGCLLGGAVGDALGLPMEGLSRKRQLKLYPQKIDGYRFFFGKGMISDDTEHSCFTAIALARSKGDEPVFEKILARSLRVWLITMPAGIGYATLRAGIKLWLGFSPKNSGVFSAGNGPAMRAGIIGVCFGADVKKLKRLVAISTVLTHKDPKALHGALAVSLAAYMAGKNEHNAYNYIERLKEEILSNDGKDFIALVENAARCADSGMSAQDFAIEMNMPNRISGYIYHTVMIALYAWFRHKDNLYDALTDVIRCGGDTDTCAAIVGNIIGASCAKDGIPSRLIDNLMEWPLSVKKIEEIGTALAAHDDTPAIRLGFTARLLRNAFFLTIVLLHALRRTLPPY